MSEQCLLQALQRELALERAARQELEKQSVLKTRQLWHQREQQDKEVQQYQEQLSVLRTSLILAHKQQHQQGTDLYDNVQHPSPDAKHPSAATAAVVPAVRHLRDSSTPQPEDASPTKADQRKGARQCTPDSSQKRKGTQQQQQAPSACSTPAEAPAAGAASTHDPSTPAQARIAGNSCPNSITSEQHIMEPQQQQQQHQQHAHTLDTAEQLLAAASKVQQLVELLSSSEPSAAADLSVLQWQLTTIYGSLTCGGSGNSSRGGMCADGQSFDGSSSGSTAQGQRNGVLQGVACTGSDPLSPACSPATADKKSLKSRAAAVVCVDASTGTSPLREPAAAAAVAGEAEASVGDQAVDQHTTLQADIQQQQQQPEFQQQQDVDIESDKRVAAAAQLFSGAANNSSGGGGKLVAASLAWFYLEPGQPPIMKGPYDAGLMLRWFLKGFLDNALKVAGVVQTSTSSHSNSRTPPESLDDFQPLAQLLQQVQSGQGYTPAKPGKSQLPSPAKRSSPASKLQQQQQQQQHAPVVSSLGSFEPVVLGSTAGNLEAGGAPGDGILAKGGSLLAETVGWWLNMAASAQLPGSVSVVDILDKVVSSVTPQAVLKGQQ